ncbi:pheromone processing endoprotease [Cichlidogyrus casuarinus]|uniref:Pheromone processing endoprotease n=1 Tax=Cichlidogyrus casuarinus TaxID=1844966 RepID=A0ABD2Q7Y6_9PLAT
MVGVEPVSAITQSESLSWQRQEVSIYTSSWGPPDDGAVLSGPNDLIDAAINSGVSEGRGGRGSLYFFANGNGAHNDDNCGADGYINSPFIFSIQAADESGEVPFYGEICAAVGVTAFVGSALSPTIEEGNECSRRFAGTSAACPTVTGCVALMLQARFVP